MKTPHTITLIRDQGALPKYDPVTDTSTQIEHPERERVPCLANHVSQAKVFEEYGDRTQKILVVRFSQPQKPFASAIFEGGKYIPIERLDAPIKSSVRLKWVGDLDG